MNRKDAKSPGYILTGRGHAASSLREEELVAKGKALGGVLALVVGVTETPARSDGGTSRKCDQ